MMDHGYVFDGPPLDLHGFAPPGPLLSRQRLYKSPLLRRFRALARPSGSLPAETADQAFKQIPPDWLDGDEATLEKLLTKLMSRRKRVPDLNHACQSGRANPFPSWH
jgi:hypothetical protein